MQNNMYDFPIENIFLTELIFLKIFGMDKLRDSSRILYHYITKIAKNIPCESTKFPRKITD